MKLVNLIPLKEIDFKTQDAFDAYNKQHKLRPDTKVTIAGQKTTAGKAAQKSAPVKGKSVFGKDNGGDDTNSDHSVMRKIKDFVGSKGFQFGARRPSEKEDSIADKHFSSYDNKSVSAIGVDKMTGNIYASNGDYEVVLSPSGKLLKKDSVQAGLDAYDDYLQKRADKYNKRQQQIKKLKSLIGLKESKNQKK